MVFVNASPQEDLTPCDDAPKTDWTSDALTEARGEIVQLQAANAVLEHKLYYIEGNVDGFIDVLKNAWFDGDRAVSLLQLRVIAASLAKVLRN